MKLTDFLPGTVIAHNIILMSLNKSNLYTVFAIVPPKNSVMNTALCTTETTKDSLLGLDADGKICFNIYAAKDTGWYIPEGYFALRLRNKLLSAGFTIGKDTVDIDPLDSRVRTVCLHDIKAPKGQPVYIQGFKYFDKVLTRTNSKTVWCCNLYSHYDPTTQTHYVLGGVPVRECIPFEGNESLINTKQNPK